MFNGTSQDANPKQELTNVGVLKKQLDLLTDNPDLRIGGKYVEGIGTQANPLTRYADAWVPYTWDDKIEEAYKALANQTSKWQRQDPEAQVRIAEVGYSRGAVLAAGLDVRARQDAGGRLTAPRRRIIIRPQAAADARRAAVRQEVAR